MQHKHDDYLKDEYQVLQNQYENYDTRALTIKGWIATGSAVGAAIGEHSVRPSAQATWIIIATISLCIWYLEGRWRMFQHAIRDRIRVIEAHFRGDDQIFDKYKNPMPFQIYNAWFETYYNDSPIYEYEKYRWPRRPRSLPFRLAHMMILDFVFVPYLPIIIICGIFLIFRGASQ